MKGLHYTFRQKACVLSVIIFSLSAHFAVANNPCNAVLYDFGSGSGNVVPCGPSANTTSQVAIDGMGGTAFPLNGAPCGSIGEGGAATDVLWVSFIIQEGGFFEWQTVPGKDDFYWELYASPKPNPSTTDVTDACTDLIFMDCGEEFTGWKPENTPGVNNTWRFFIAFYLRNGDQEGNGVVKIRKSCGFVCAESDISVTASDDVCILNGSTALSASASGGGGGPYSYMWTPQTTLDDPTISNPTATPTMTTTYIVTATGSDNCAASEEVIVAVGGCCEADAGMITNNGTGPFNSCLGRDLIVSGTEIIFSQSGHNASLGYAFILVDDDGNIDDFNTSGNFDFSTLDADTYTVYGLSYDESANTPMDVSTYLGSKSTIIAIENDDSDNGGTFCLDLVNGAAGGNVVTILDVDCGNFAWPGD